VAEVVTVEERAIEEIRAVLQKYNCVLSVRERSDPVGRFGDTITEIKVHHANYEHGPTAGVVLHSE
jgi:hypothetical protein